MTAKLLPGDCRSARWSLRLSCDPSRRRCQMRMSLAVFVCLLLAACRASDPRPTDTAAIRAAIDDASARLSQGLRTGQLDASAAVLTDDHYNMPPNHPPISGRSAWLAATRAMLAGGHWSSVTTPESRMYGDSLTIDRGRYINTVVPASNAPGTLQPVSDTGKYVWLWRRTSRGWQLAEAIWNSNAALKP